jgi:GT2 family glycosyltransferase
LPESILVGQTSDPRSNQITYGGLKRIGRHPHRLQIINAQEKYELADTFCGNIVLIPSKINLSLSGIDGNYQHGYADYDFGYRAKKMGFNMQIIPGFLGTCLVNPPLLSSWNFLKYLKILTSKKYLPIRSQIRFCKRHGGPEWPIYVIAPYLRAILKIKPFRSNRTNAGF